MVILCQRHPTRVDASSRNWDSIDVATVGEGRDFLASPERVTDEMGNALGLAQLGGRHPAAKQWQGQGPGVFELVEDFDGDTYRAVYTVRFREVVYVLHAFQKKSPAGVRTARGDVALIGRRPKLAQQDYEARHGKR